MNNDEAQKLRPDNWPIPDESLIEIGRVAALWATLSHS
jgi:hypothetical protein